MGFIVFGLGRTGDGRQEGCLKEKQKRQQSEHKDYFPLI